MGSRNCVVGEMSGPTQVYCLKARARRGLGCKIWRCVAREGLAILHERVFQRTKIPTPDEPFGSRDANNFPQLIIARVANSSVRSFNGVIRGLSSIAARSPHKMAKVGNNSSSCVTGKIFQQSRAVSRKSPQALMADLISLRRAIRIPVPGRFRMFGPMNDQILRNTSKSRTEGD